MTRPYIKCPLEAALAFKNLGFKIVSKYQSSLTLMEFHHGGYWVASDGIGYTGVLYISDESLPLLEPMVGDICELKGNPDYDHYDTTWEVILKINDLPDPIEFETDNSGFYRGKFQECFTRIVERNGKPFPKIEQD